MNLTVDDDIVQESRCKVCSSPAPDAALIRQWPWSLFWDKFLGNRKHNAYKLYSQYADLCNTFEKYSVSFPASQPETHESINKIQTPVSPVSGTNPSEKGDHYRKSGDSEQPLVSANTSSHQLEKTLSQVDGSDVTGKLENISHNSHNSKFTDNTFDIQHESHNLLKLETSNMDTSIPIKKSTMKNPSEERSYMGAFPRDRMKNVCFNCWKHGHFAYECPDLCPPSRADKDSNWRHSMKQRNVHESKIGNRHFNQSPAQNSIDKHNVPSVQNKLFLIFLLFLNHRFVLFRKTSQLNIMSQVWVIIIQFVIMLICLTHNQMSIWMKILIVIFVIIM